MDKKGINPINILDLILGLCIVAGGISIIFNYVNLGLLLAALGTLFEALKIVIVQGPKWYK